MDFRIQTADVAAWGKVACDALLLVVPAGQAPAGLDKGLASALDALASAGDLEWKADRSVLVHRPSRVQAARLAVVVAAGASVKAFRKALASGVQALKSGGARDVAVAACGATAGDAHAEALAVVVSDALYTYRHTKPSAPPAPSLRSFTLLCAEADRQAAEAGLARGIALAQGIELARECANRPGNHCTPTDLAAEARKLGKQHGLKVEVMDRKDVEKLGMGAFLAVAQGSDEPLRFIVARWNGAGRGVPPVVLVGKGITFDSGGISIKPAAEMDEMKFDMGGAASVLGTLKAIASMKAPVNLVGVIAACENLPGGRAVKPGDVVKTMSGQTVEILNTDAEGRLILCDALTYVERFAPAAVVDIATLTGACMIALGGVRSGLFTPDESLAEQLDRAGEAAHDLCWRMPVDAEYDESLKSNFADMANVGPRQGGAITAAMFLKRFTGKYRWAHLDIAGTAWKSGAAKGATGRPVGLLTHFVLRHANP